MKKILLLLLLAASFSVKAQSLKELLYSGKLKKDSSGVIRKDDDLSAKIDTSTRKVLPETPVATAPANAEKKIVADTAAITPPTPLNANASGNPADAKVDNNASAGAGAPVKSNTKILKEYTDSLSAALTTELKDSKKIKKGTYYLTAEYEIGTDGNVEILNVVSSPENELLQGMAKERMIQSAPRLAPGLDSNNQPRKVKRKYNFTVTKD